MYFDMKKKWLGQQTKRTDQNLIVEDKFNYVIESKKQRKKLEREKKANCHEDQLITQK
jgi:hypothetical protein